MGSGRPYLNKDYFKLLLALICASALYMYYSFGYMTYIETNREIFIQDIFKSYKNAFGDSDSQKSQYSQRIAVTGGLVRKICISFTF